MGILRLYLALCVLNSHLGSPWAMHTGTAAVEIFYIISGFYMQMIFAKYPTTKEFYFSRALRIYAPYWSVAILVLVVSLFSGLFLGDWLNLTHWVHQPWERNGLLGLSLVALSNVIVFMQDWVMFLSHQAGESLHFIRRFRDDRFPLYPYLLVPQAWSVSVELTFYLFVPLLAKLKTRWMMGILCISLLARVYCYRHYYLNFDPWTYRFFPFELAWFVLGMLARRWAFDLPKLSSQWVSSFRRYLPFAVGLVLLFSLSRFLSDWAEDQFGFLGTSVTYGCWAAIIPLLFSVTSQVKKDRVLGELSYPVYLCHVFVKDIVGKVAKTWSWSPDTMILCSWIATLIVSILIYLWVIVPMDRRRYRLAHRLAGSA